MKCPSCPVAAGLACVSELRPEDVMLCPLAGTAPHWDWHIVGRSAIERDDPSPPPAPPPMPAAPPDPARAAAIAATNRLMARAKRCEHFSRSCGCAWGRCALGRGPLGDGAISHEDCRSCELLPPEA